MKTPALATVYLDNASVGLMGDPLPRVSKILVAGGKQPGSVQVLRSRSATDQKGTPVRMDDVIDRTAEPTRPIYLRSKPNAVTVEAPSTMEARTPASIDFASADETGRKPLGSPLPGDTGRDGGFGPSPARRASRGDPEWRL